MPPVFTPRNTGAIQMDEPHKVLLYAHHGFGKTFQAGKFETAFGKGLVLSGEGGLKSLANSNIDYFPFQSWDGLVDPANDIFSFRSLAGYVSGPDFAAAGYKWIAIDSLTELSDRLMEHVAAEHAGDDKKNGFAIWDEYGTKLIGALKWVRDLPVHVLVTSLAKEESDINDNAEFWPMVKGKAVAKQIPGLFDHVFCGVRVTETQTDGQVKVKRLIITDEVNGWHGKVRDPFNRVKPFEDGADITDLLLRMQQRPTV